VQRLAEATKPGWALPGDFMTSTTAAPPGAPERLTLTTSDVQQLTGWGRDHIRTLVRAGKLLNVGTTKRLLVTRSALQRYLEGAK
jgi:hypothetical protein